MKLYNLLPFIQTFLLVVILSFCGCSQKERSNSVADALILGTALATESALGSIGLDSTETYGVSDAETQSTLGSLFRASFTILELIEALSAY